MPQGPRSLPHEPLVSTGATASQPIFIVGAPRSGTTLLRVLLNRHPNIAICDETFFFYWVYSRRRAFGDLSDPDNRRRLIEAYLSTWRIRRLELDRSWLAERLFRDGRTYASLFASLITGYAESRSKKRSGEKTPQHVEHVETLIQWFPDASILHIVRDPRDVVASLLRMPWGHRSAAANAIWWADLVGAARHIESLPCYLSIRYEDLIHDPRSLLSEICSSIGEPYVDEFLSTDSADTAAPDRSWYRRAHEPLSGSRVGLWRNDLTQRQVRMVEWLTGPLMATYGYEATEGPASTLLKARARASMGAERIRQTADLPRIWHRWLRPRELVNEERHIDGGTR